MRVLVVSGIWPPDVGGPASHAPEVADFLRSRGHRVEVVTTAEIAPPPRPYPVRFTPRRLPVGVRHAHGAVMIAARARRADVVYATGMFARTAAAAFVAECPYVVKLTADPAFERARTRQLFAGDVDAFQDAEAGGLRLALLRRVRDLSLARAAHVLCPSVYLRELAIGWGLEEERVSVLPNPAPAPVELAPREELRARLGFHGPTLAFAGRLTAQKSLATALEALARVDGVALAIAGDGPESGALRRRAAELGVDGRVRFLGPRPRLAVLELFAAADAAILPSSWENFPHTVVEALAVGTPVIASDVGGVRELVRDGDNGLLVPAGDGLALAAAVERYVRDPGLQARMRAAAAPSVDAYRPERVFARLDHVLLAAARRER